MRIAFIGGGVMAEAIMRGILSKNLASPESISVGETIAERRRELAEDHGVFTTEDNKEALSRGEIVVLAVKPQNLPDAFASLKGNIAPGASVR